MHVHSTKAVYNSEEFRQVDNDSNPLILSYIKPHRPITVQRIAHWIKDILEEAGVDTGTFKAHSVRGAATSAALAKGVSIEEILRTADWSTFRRFYYTDPPGKMFFPEQSCNYASDNITICLVVYSHLMIECNMCYHTQFQLRIFLFFCGLPCLIMTDDKYGLRSVYWVPGTFALLHVYGYLGLL